MAGKKISALTPASSIDENDNFVIARTSPAGNFKVSQSTMRKLLIPDGDDGESLFFRAAQTEFTGDGVTVSVVIDDGVVTLTGDTWPDWADDGDLLVDGELYSVATRDSDTQLTLDNTTVDVVAAAAFTLSQLNLVAEDPRYRVLTASTDDSGDYSATTPTLPITGATNTTPIQITCVNHRLKTGQHCRITGVLGNTAANNKAVGDGPTSGTNAANPEMWEVDAGTLDIVDATNASPIVISTYPIRHNFVTGDRVRVEGVEGNTAANSGYSTGTITVAAASAIVTLSGGTWPASAASGYLVVDGNQYTVQTRDSDTQLTLTTTITDGVAAGSLYQLWIAFSITVVSDTTFSLTSSVGNGAYDGNGQVSLANNFYLKKLDNATRVNVSGAAAGYSSRIRITTSSAHGFTDYDNVIVKGVGGTTEANNTTSNDTWQIDVITTTTFDLIGSTFANAYTSGGTVELAFANSLQDVAGTGTYTSGGTMIRPGRIKIWATDLDAAESRGFVPGLPLRMKTAENGYSYGIIGSVPGYEGYPITRDVVSPTNVAYELTFAGPPLLGNLTELAIGDPRMVHQLDFTCNKHPYYGSDTELPLSQLIQNNTLVDKWRMTGGGTVYGNFAEAYQRYLGPNGFIVAWHVVHREPATQGDFGDTGSGTTVTITADASRPLNSDGQHTDGCVRRGSLIERLAGTGLTITGTTNATPIVVTSAAHGLSNGNIVNISGCDASAANGTWVVTNSAANTFELYNRSGGASVGTGVGTTGTIYKHTAFGHQGNGETGYRGYLMNKQISATITGTTNASPVVVTSASHGFSNGNIITITGCDVSANNGRWVVTNKFANTFELYTLAGVASSAPGGVGTTGTARNLPEYSVVTESKQGSDNLVGIIDATYNAGFTLANGAATGTTTVNILRVAHGLRTGQLAQIKGMTGKTGCNGIWKITKVDADNFTLDGATGSAGASVGGDFTFPVVVTTDGRHGQSDGCYVLIHGVPGNTNANGNYYVDSLSSTTFGLFSDSGKTITSTTAANPIVVTSTAHGFSNGDIIRIFNCGNTIANGTFVVANVAANTFELTDAAGNNVNGTGGSTQGGGNICTSRVGNSAHTGCRAPLTITGASYATPISITSASHGLSNGDQVIIDGVNGNTNANGLWTVANSAANTFDLTDYSSNSAIGNGFYAGGGTISRCGGFVQNQLLNTQWVLESMTMSGAAGTKYQLIDVTLQPWVNIDVGGQLLSQNNMFRGLRTNRVDNRLIFAEAAEIQRESYDIVRGTRLEVASTSIGNRPGVASSDDTDKGGAQFLVAFIQVVEE